MISWDHVYMDNGNKKQKCSCGRIHKEVPSEARLWDMGEVQMWIWECSCLSSILSPVDEQTATQLNVPLLPKAGNKEAA